MGWLSDKRKKYAKKLTDSWHKVDNTAAIVGSHLGEAVRDAKSVADMGVISLATGIEAAADAAITLTDAGLGDLDEYFGVGASAIAEGSGKILSTVGNVGSYIPDIGGEIIQQIGHATGSGKLVDAGEIISAQRVPGFEDLSAAGEKLEKWGNKSAAKWMDAIEEDDDSYWEGLKEGGADWYGRTGDKFTVANDKFKGEWKTMKETDQLYEDFRAQVAGVKTDEEREALWSELRAGVAQAKKDHPGAEPSDWFTVGLIAAGGGAGHLLKGTVIKGVPVTGAIQGARLAGGPSLVSLTGPTDEEIRARAEAIRAEDRKAVVIESTKPKPVITEREQKEMDARAAEARQEALRQEAIDHMMSGPTVWTSGSY